MYELPIIVTDVGVCLCEIYVCKMTRVINTTYFYLAIGAACLKHIIALFSFRFIVKAFFKAFLKNNEKAVLQKENAVLQDA